MNSSIDMYHDQRPSVTTQARIEGRPPVQKSIARSKQLKKEFSQKHANDPVAGDVSFEINF